MTRWVPETPPCPNISDLSRTLPGSTRVLSVAKITARIGTAGSSPSSSNSFTAQELASWSPLNHSNGCWYFFLLPSALSPCLCSGWKGEPASYDNCRRFQTPLSNDAHEVCCFYDIMHQRLIYYDRLLNFFFSKSLLSLGFRKHGGVGKQSICKESHLLSVKRGGTGPRIDLAVTQLGNEAFWIRSISL